MRFVVELLHPRHVHFFRYFIGEMQLRGHEFLVTARHKDCTLELLEAYGIPHVVLSRQKHGVLRLGLELAQRLAGLVSVARAFRPDYVIGYMGPTVALAAKILGTRGAVFYDNETVGRLNRAIYMLSDIYYSPAAYPHRYGPKHHVYMADSALAYLHPNRFRPDPDVLTRYGLAPGARFSVLRFVSWKSMHEVGGVGFSTTSKRRIIDTLLGHGRVILTSEGAIPSDLERYRSRIAVEDLHHLLAYADLCVGESATMAAEACVLGTHAVLLTNRPRAATLDQERRYGLVHNFLEGNEAQALARITDLLSDGALKEDAARRRRQLLEEQVDVTGFMIDQFDRNPP
jgi:uncharacterized protein